MMFETLAKKGKTIWWSHLLSIALVVLGFALGQIPLLIAFHLKKKTLGMTDTEFEKYFSNNEIQAFGIEENLLLFLSNRFLAILSPSH